MPPPHAAAGVGAAVLLGILLQTMCAPTQQVVLVLVVLARLGMLVLLLLVLALQVLQVLQMLRVLQASGWHLDP